MYSEFSCRGRVVQKYGGTSVGSIERIQAMAARVASFVREGWGQVAIVVSAMAGETNRVAELIHNINPKASAKHFDLAVSTGEQVSVALFAAALEAEGISAHPYLAYQLGVYTKGLPSQARIHEIRTEPILQSWEHGAVPVVAGFQGVSGTGELTTLGRGGSDISAVALSVALKASFCEINTDVDGVYTADPRIVPTARLLERLDYDTALEMAALGSKVLHSRCVELAAKHKMPLVVRNSFKEESSRRTKMTSFTAEQALEAPVVSGVSLERGVAKINITGLPKDGRSVSEIFARVAKVGVNVDIIVQNAISDKSTLRLGFTVNRSDLEKTLAEVKLFRKEAKDLGQMRISTRADLAKVSVVGLGMRSYAGVASRVFCVLADAQIELDMISTSEIKISCVVPERDSERATRTLHEAFFPTV